MRFTARQNAPEGTKFAPESFIKNIGKEIPVLFPSESTTRAMGRVVEVHVAEDGGSVEITYELDNEVDVLRHLKVEDLQDIEINHKWSNKTLMDQYLAGKGYSPPPMEEKWITIWK